MIEKQREFSSRRRAYKTYRYEAYLVILSPFRWYHKDPEAHNGFESENWTIEEEETFLKHDMINTIKPTGLYEKNYLSNEC